MPLPCESLPSDIGGRAELSAPAATSNGSMGTRRGILALVMAALLSCSPEPKDPNQVELTLESSARVLKEGRPIPLEEIARWRKPEGVRFATDPFLIHVPEHLPVAKFIPLFEALLGTGRVNVAVAPPGQKPVLLPVFIDG